METTDQSPKQPPRIVVIGSINMDLIVRAETLPEPGETHIGHELIQSPGGKGANQAVAAAQLGANVLMLGRVGSDAYSHRLINQLFDYDVDTSHILETPDCPSGLAIVHVDSVGENAITVLSGANSQLSPDDIELAEPLIAKADAVLMQLEVPLPSVCVAVEIARKHGVMTVLDPAPAPPYGQHLPEALKHVDWVVPNKIEAELLTQERIHDPQKAKLVGAEMIRMGIRNVAITLGGHGAVVVTAEGTVLHEPGFKVDVADTTAAGDAFSAALTVARAEGQTISRSVRFACAAGALVSSRWGAQQAMPTRSEVEEIL